MQELIRKVASGAELSEAEIRESAAALTHPDGDVETKAEFLTALHRRGETPAEIAGYVACFLDAAVDPGINDDGNRPLIDVCGTGGDRSGFFNVSTGAMFVAAACGAAVVKHGNRGITSKCGGADVLEALGVPVDLPPAQTGGFLDRCGFVFLFAPLYHPAFKAVAPVRKLLAGRGQASMFNILGPLLNPARPRHQLTGVYDPQLIAVYADVLAKLGREKAWVVHGSLPGGGGLDELSIAGESRVAEVRDGRTRTFVVRPDALGFAVPDLEQLQGGDAAANAEMLLGVLRGETGPRRDIVMLNAGAALVAADLENDLEAAVRRAAEAIDSGAAHEVLIRARGESEGV